MKRFLILASLILIGLVATGTALGQQSCEFSIVGTWKAATPDSATPISYRFAPEGKVTALSPSGPDRAAEPRVVGSTTYEVDDPKAPKSVTFKAIPGSGIFARRGYSMKIIKYDDDSFTCVRSGSAPTRWIRVDPNLYFIVLAARNGEFYDGSGSAFALLMKLVGRESQLEGVGTYSAQGKRAFGLVPRATYTDLMKEARNESEVMLRLKINSAQYERALKILRTWERRVREDALLYPTGSYLNNVLLVKAVTETLNQCSEEIKLYNLNYLHPQDWIAEQFAPPFIPFAYFKELRRLNESLHVRDEKLKQVSVSAGLSLEP